MSSSRHSPLASRAAFSIVEVALAIGIVAFGFLAVFGLLPVGMDVFRQSINGVINSQIAQSVVNDAQQSDFQDLITDANGNTIVAGSTGTKPVRYFDNQAGELASPSNAIYWVNTRITPATTLPATSTAASANANLATVTIQIANNPAGLQLTATNNLWIGASQSNTSNASAVPISTYITVVARSK